MMHFLLTMSRPLVSRSARHSLADRFSERDSRAIVGKAFRIYRAEAPTAPAEPTWNGRLMVHLAALTAAFYRTLVGRGLSDAEAEQRTAETTWAVYRKMGAVPGWLSARLARNERDRVRRATDYLRRFPFSSPAYEMVDLPGDERTVAFDVVRCPVAEYFHGQGLDDLCVKTFCQLDFPLAQEWGARLERTGTLASGARRCDFRWRVSSNGEK